MTLIDRASKAQESPWEESEDVALELHCRLGEDFLVTINLRPTVNPEDYEFELYRGDPPLPSDRFRVVASGNLVQLTLQHPSRDDAGHYALIAKKLPVNNESERHYSRRIHMSVDEPSFIEEGDPPLFLRRLTDLTVKVGTRTRFLVEIRSATDPKVTWHRNDEPIQAGPRFSFVHEGNFFCVDVAPVTVEDQGHWTCMAENRSGRSSCTSHLNVLVPKAYKRPEFVSELRALLTETGTVSLECKVVGVPTPVLKWFKDGKEIKAGDVFALTANPDDPTSLGTYTCEAVNCMGTAYSSSRVHVVGKGSREGSLKPADTLIVTGDPPIFKRILRDDSCRIGESLSLSCQVQVPPWPKEITWYNKDGRVEANERYKIMEDGLGGYSITVNPVEAVDEGEWKCVATSSENVKQFTTCFVAMSIPKNYRKPRFMESLKAVLTEEGLVSFECKVVGFPTPLLRWFKDGQELKPGDVYQLTGTNSLGSYCCIAKNCMGEAKSTAELTVEDIQNQLNEEERLQLLTTNQPPKFIKGLRSSEAKITEKFRFSVQVSIMPEPSLAWYRDDHPVENENKYLIERETLGICHLEIQRLEFCDQAEWKCVASNDFGQSVTSCFLKLIIPKHYKKPKFLENLRAILSDGGAVNLECKVIGVPQPVLKWYKDGVELKPGDIHRIISGQDGTCCLGTYTCEATNCMGTVSSSASLLGFEDRVSAGRTVDSSPQILSQIDHEHELARNLSLSTIHEERTSQLLDTAQTDHSATIDDRGEVSFSFDGKEVSVSLYETPDLTEEEALQIVEMYADQLSEHVTEHNVVELPPMRFVKETSTSGNLLMEAVVIDVSPDYFVSVEEGDERTEADFEDMSILDGVSLSSPPTEPIDENRIPTRPPRRKSGSVSSKFQEQETESYHSAREPLLSLNQKKDEFDMDLDSEAFADALSSARTRADSIAIDDKSQKEFRKRSISGGSSLEAGDSSFDSVSGIMKKKKKEEKKPKKKRRLGEKGSSEDSSIGIEDEDRHKKLLESKVSFADEEEEGRPSSRTNKERLVDLLRQISEPVLVVREALIDYDSLMEDENLIDAFVTDNVIIPIQSLCELIADIETKALKSAGDRSLLQTVRITILETIGGPTEELLRGLELIRRQESHENFQMNLSILESLIDPVDEILFGLAKLEFELSGRNISESPVVLERTIRTTNSLGLTLKEVNKEIGTTMISALYKIHETLNAYLNSITLNQFGGWTENIDAVLVESLARPLEDLERSSKYIIQGDFSEVTPEMINKMSDAFSEILSRLDTLVVALEGYESDYRTNFVVNLKTSLVTAAEELSKCKTELVDSSNEKQNLPEMILDSLIDAQTAVNSVLHEVELITENEAKILQNSELALSLAELRAAVSYAVHKTTTLKKDETINALVNLKEPLIDLHLSLSTQREPEEIAMIKNIITPLDSLQKVMKTVIEYVGKSESDIEISEFIKPIHTIIEELKQQIPMVLDNFEKENIKKQIHENRTTHIDSTSAIQHTINKLQMASELSTIHFELATILEKCEKVIGTTEPTHIFLEIGELRQSIGNAAITIDKSSANIEPNIETFVKEIFSLQEPLMKLQNSLLKENSTLQERQIIIDLLKPLEKLKEVVINFAEEVIQTDAITSVITLINDIEKDVLTHVEIVTKKADEEEFSMKTESYSSTDFRYKDSAETVAIETVQNQDSIEQISTKISDSLITKEQLDDTIQKSDEQQHLELPKQFNQGSDVSTESIVDRVTESSIESPDLVQRRLDKISDKHVIYPKEEFAFAISQSLGEIQQDISGILEEFEQESVTTPHPVSRLAEALENLRRTIVVVRSNISQIAVEISDVNSESSHAESYESAERISLSLKELLQPILEVREALAQTQDHRAPELLLLNRLDQPIRAIEFNVLQLALEAHSHTVESDETSSRASLDAMARALEDIESQIPLALDEVNLRQEILNIVCNVSKPLEVIKERMHEISLDTTNEDNLELDVANILNEPINEFKNALNELFHRVGSSEHHVEKNRDAVLMLKFLIEPLVELQSSLSVVRSSRRTSVAESGLLDERKNVILRAMEEVRFGINKIRNEIVKTEEINSLENLIVSSVDALDSAIVLVQDQVSKANYVRRRSCLGTLEQRTVMPLQQLAEKIAVIEEQMDETTLDLILEPLETLWKQIQIAQMQFVQSSDQPLDEEAIIEGFLYPVKHLLSSLETAKQNQEFIGSKNVVHLLEELGVCTESLGSTLLTLQNELIEEGANEKASIIETLTAVSMPLNSINNIIKEISENTKDTSSQTHQEKIVSDNQERSEDSDKKIQKENDDKKAQETNGKVPTILTTVETIVDEFIEVSKRETESLTMLKFATEETNFDTDKELCIAADQMEIMMTPKGEKMNLQIHEEIIPMEVESSVTDTAESNSQLNEGIENTDINIVETATDLITERRDSVIALWSLIKEPLNNLQECISLIFESPSAISIINNEEGYTTQDHIIMAHLTDLRTSIAAMQQIANEDSEQILAMSGQENSLPILQNLATCLEELGEHLPSLASQNVFTEENLTHTEETHDSAGITNALRTLIAPLQELRECLGLIVEEQIPYEPKVSDGDFQNFEEEHVEEIKESALTAGDQTQANISEYQGNDIKMIKQVEIEVSKSTSNESSEMKNKDSLNIAKEEIAENLTENLLNYEESIVNMEKAEIKTSFGEHLDVKETDINEGTIDLEDLDKQKQAFVSKQELSREMVMAEVVLGETVNTSESQQSSDFECQEKTIKEPLKEHVLIEESIVDENVQAIKDFKSDNELIGQGLIVEQDIEDRHLAEHVISEEIIVDESTNELKKIGVTAGENQPTAFSEKEKSELIKISSGEVDMGINTEIIDNLETTPFDIQEVKLQDVLPKENISVEEIITDESTKELKDSHAASEGKKEIIEGYIKDEQVAFEKISSSQTETISEIQSEVQEILETENVIDELQQVDNAESDSHKPEVKDTQVNEYTAAEGIVIDESTEISKDLDVQDQKNKANIVENIVEQSSFAKVITDDRKTLCYPETKEEIQDEIKDLTIEQVEEKNVSIKDGLSKEHIIAQEIIIAEEVEGLKNITDAVDIKEEPLITEHSEEEYGQLAKIDVKETKSFLSSHSCDEDEETQNKILKAQIMIEDETEDLKRMETESLESGKAQSTFVSHEAGVISEEIISGEMTKELDESIESDVLEKAAKYAEQSPDENILFENVIALETKVEEARDVQIQIQETIESDNILMDQKEQEASEHIVEKEKVKDDLEKLGEQSEVEKNEEEIFNLQGKALWSFIKGPLDNLQESISLIIESPLSIEAINKVEAANVEDHVIIKCFTDLQTAIAAVQTAIIDDTETISTTLTETNLPIIQNLVSSIEKLGLHLPVLAGQIIHEREKQLSIKELSSSVEIASVVNPLISPLRELKERLEIIVNEEKKQKETEDKEKVQERKNIREIQEDKSKVIQEEPKEQKIVEMSRKDESQIEKQAIEIKDKVEVEELQEKEICEKSITNKDLKIGEEKDQAKKIEKQDSDTKPTDASKSLEKEKIEIKDEEKQLKEDRALWFILNEPLYHLQESISLIVESSSAISAINEAESATLQDHMIVKCLTDLKSAMTAVQTVISDDVDIQTWKVGSLSSIKNLTLSLGNLGALLPALAGQIILKTDESIDSNESDESKASKTLKLLIIPLQDLRDKLNIIVEEDKERNKKDFQRQKEQQKKKEEENEKEKSETEVKLKEEKESKTNKEVEKLQKDEDEHKKQEEAEKLQKEEEKRKKKKEAEMLQKEEDERKKKEEAEKVRKEEEERQKKEEAEKLQKEKEERKKKEAEKLKEEDEHNKKNEAEKLQKEMERKKKETEELKEEEERNKKEEAEKLQKEEEERKNKEEAEKLRIEEEERKRKEIAEKLKEEEETSKKEVKKVEEESKEKEKGRGKEGEVERLKKENGKDKKKVELEKTKKKEESLKKKKESDKLSNEELIEERKTLWSLVKEPLSHLQDSISLILESPSAIVIINKSQISPIEDQMVINSLTDLQISIASLQSIVDDDQDYSTWDVKNLPKIQNLGSSLERLGVHLPTLVSHIIAEHDKSILEDQSDTNIASQLLKSLVSPLQELRDRLTIIVEEEKMRKKIDDDQLNSQVDEYNKKKKLEKTEKETDTKAQEFDKIEKKEVRRKRFETVESREKSDRKIEQDTELTKKEETQPSRVERIKLDKSLKTNGGIPKTKEYKKQESEKLDSSIALEKTSYVKDFDHKRKIKSLRYEDVSDLSRSDIKYSTPSTLQSKKDSSAIDSTYKSPRHILRSDISKIDYSPKYSSEIFYNKHKIIEKESPSKYDYKKTSIGDLSRLKLDSIPDFNYLRPKPQSKFMSRSREDLLHRENDFRSSHPTLFNGTSIPDLSSTGRSSYGFDNRKYGSYSTSLLNLDSEPKTRSFAKLYENFKKEFDHPTYTPKSFHTSDYSLSVSDSLALNRSRRRFESRKANIIYEGISESKSKSRLLDRGKCPMFCTKLTNCTVAEGSHVRFICTAVGQPEPQIYWTKNGDRVRPGGRERTKYENGMASLEITSAELEDSGYYTCVAKNSYGQSTTEAMVRVYSVYESSSLGPTFTSALNDKYKLSDRELILETRVRGQPTPSIAWLKDERILRGDRYRQSLVGDGFCRLHISEPNLADSGQYVCRASTDKSSEIRHMVHFDDFENRKIRKRKDNFVFDNRFYDSGRERSKLPKISTSLSDYKVPAGGTIALQVEIKDTPTPNVTWLRDRGERKELISSPKIRTFAEKGVYTLILPEATEYEAGTYVCRVSNAYGHVDTSATVEVIPLSKFDDLGKPAMFVSRPAEKMMYVMEGEAVSVSFRISGTPRPRLVWTKGVKDITDGPRSHKEMIDDYVRLTLNRVNPEDEGTYCILVKNCYGCDRSFFTLKIRQRARSLTPTAERLSLSDHLSDIKEQQSYLRNVPGPISSEPIVVDGGRNWLSLSWGKADQRGPAPVIAYRVDAWQMGGDGGARWAELGISPINSFDAFNLRPGGEYKFRVTPRNRYGWGESVTMSGSATVCDDVEIPEFTKILPGQLKALVDSNVNLECEVRSDSKFDVKWFKETSEIDSNIDSRYIIKNERSKCSLILKNINENDTGRYICEVSNKAGKVSSYGRILVVNDEIILKADARLKKRFLDGLTEEGPPQFTMRLRDRRVQTSYPVRLTCQVFGCPEPEVTWYKDGITVIETSTRSIYIDESHFHTLEIARSNLEDSGHYTACAKNENGSVSCHCVLVVDKGIRAYIAPEFLYGLDVAYAVKIGGDLRLTAQIEAYPSVGIVWHRDGIRLRPRRRGAMTLSHDGTVELLLSKVTSRDAGVYTCTATNAVGKAETSTRISVIGPEDSVTYDDSSHHVVVNPPDADIPYSKVPLFVTKPLSTEAQEGDTVIIQCEVVGDPKPEVMWLRDFLKPDYYRDAAHFRRIGAGPQYSLEIPHAKLDYTGTYSVLARNEHGEAKAVISLQIYAKGQGKGDSMDQSSVKQGDVLSVPTIKTELKDIRCCDGDAITLECKVYAPSEPPIVRWEKGGKPLPLGGDFSVEFDGEVAKLTIHHVYPEDEGEYTCVATNELGKAFTSACLVVDVPEGKENVLSQPLLTRPQGLLSANSTPRSTPRSTPVRSLSPAVSRGRELKAMQLPRRIDSAGSIRRKPKVCPPKFYTIPHNRVAEEGETIRFQCAVAGHPIPWCTWDKDGVTVTPSARISVKEKDDIRILEITEVTLEDAGLYRVTLENDVGRTEASARLEIINRNTLTPRPIRTRSASPRTYPTFTRSLLSTSTRLNGRLQLQCDIRGSPSPSTSWFRNGNRIERSARIKRSFVGERAVLEILGVKLSDAGEYVCEAKNLLGTTRSSCKVVVLEADDPSTQDREPPKFLNAIPSESIVMEGHSYELQARLSGTPPFMVIWQKDGHEVIDSDYYRHVVYEDGGVALRFLNVHPLDAGDYTCIVRNDHGEVNCRGLFVVQDYKSASSNSMLSFVKTPVPVFVEKGETACFCARIQSDRSIDVDWTINGKSVREDRRCKIERDGSTSILRIPHVSQQDCGEIRCIASITRGPSISSSVQLRLKPSSPSKLQNNLLKYIEPRSRSLPRSKDDGEQKSNGLSSTPNLRVDKNTIDSKKRASSFTRLISKTRDSSSESVCEKSPKVNKKLPNGHIFGKSVDKPFMRNGSIRKSKKQIKEPVKKVENKMPIEPIEITIEPIEKVHLNIEPVEKVHIPIDARFDADEIDESIVEILAKENIIVPIDTNNINEDTIEVKSSSKSTSPAKDSIVSIKRISSFKNLCNSPTFDENMHNNNNNNNEEEQSDKETMTHRKPPPSPQIRARQLPESETLTSIQNKETSVAATQVPALVLRPPDDVITLRGSTVILEATYQGHPEPSVKWMRAGRELVADERTNIDNVAGLSILTLISITADQAGKYAVSVDNTLGSDCRFASVAVEGPPEPPCDPPCISPIRRDTDDYGALITWCSPAYDGGCALTGYTVERRRIGELNWRIVAENCHSLSHEILHDLRPGATYIFRVRALNIHGPGEPSPESRPFKVPFVDMELAEDKLKVEEDQANMEDENEDYDSADKIVTPEEGQFFKERYTLHEELGKGRYGVVRRVIENKTEKSYAAKFVRTVKTSDRQQVREEMKIMNMLRHPKLLRLTAAFESPKEIVMVTEYISGGELFERVVADDFTLTEKDSILFMRQICEGVRYMHENNIVHLDLKPENIMCHTRTSHRIKLIDFGLAQILSPSKPVRVLFGTPEFIPPEIINYEPIGTESDMWSVGVICYVLLTGLSPFMGDNDAETFANIVRADYDFEDEAFDAISPDAKDFISNLLQKKKELRMSAKQCLSHSWLAQHTENMSRVALPTDKLKKFIVRRKWQKTGNALRALGRMAMLSANRRSPSLSPTSTRSLSEVTRSESLDSENLDDSIKKEDDESLEHSMSDSDVTKRIAEVSLDLENQEESVKKDDNKGSSEHQTSENEVIKKVIDEEEIKISEVVDEEEIKENLEEKNTSEVTTSNKAIICEETDDDVFEISKENSIEDVSEKLNKSNTDNSDYRIESVHSFEPLKDSEVYNEINEVLNNMKLDKNGNHNKGSIENLSESKESLEDESEENTVLENQVKTEEKESLNVEESDNDGNNDDDDQLIKDNKADEVVKNLDYDNFKKEENQTESVSYFKYENVCDVEENYTSSNISQKSSIARVIDKLHFDEPANNDGLSNKKPDVLSNFKANKDIAFDRDQIRRSFRKFNAPFEANPDEDTRLDGSPSRSRPYTPTGNVSRTAKLFEKLETEQHQNHHHHHHQQQQQQQQQNSTNRGNGVATPPNNNTVPSGKPRSERIQRAFAFWNK